VLKHLVIFLGHKYPRIRKHAADALYIQFLSDQRSIGISVEEAAAQCDALSETEATGGAGGADAASVVAREKVFCGLAPTGAALLSAQDVLASTAWDGGSVGTCKPNIQGHSLRFYDLYFPQCNAMLCCAFAQPYSILREDKSSACRSVC